MQANHPARTAAWTVAAACCLLYYCSPDSSPVGGSNMMNNPPPAQQPKPPAAPSGPAPYVYAAPVKGHYEEASVATFNVVDGLAYTSAAGTVVFASSKPIGSPMFAASICPMTQARAVALLRNADFLEITLGADGQSAYFAAGTRYKGQGRAEETGTHAWQVTPGKQAAGRVAGSVTYKDRGGFEFDLPVYKPAVKEVSEGERIQGERFDATRRAPSEKELVGVYAEVLRAVRAKDLKAYLTLQGFDAKQVDALRGLAGIDADMAAHAEHFLDPGTPQEPAVGPGHAQVGGRGKNPKGAAFANTYEWAPCGDKLVLVGIGENPQ